ncbi:hypothetical protein [Buttiauxella noackiae]|uniref:hypothetical protein n=1 Tax=Buttiauxella noackiae TaxID=82992 RepID=UPI0036F30497
MCRKVIRTDTGRHFNIAHRPGDIVPIFQRPMHAAIGENKIIDENGLDMMFSRTMPDYYRLLPGKLPKKLVLMDK